MVTTVSEYGVSLKEIVRRKKAFTALVMSIWFGLVIFAFSIFLFISRILTIKALNDFSHIRFLINDEKIKRVVKKSEEIILFRDIVKLKIKRTTKGYIREIKIGLKEGNDIFVNGLNDFEKFKEKVINHCSKSIIIKEMNELIDFDHPFFYIFFGFAVSSISTTFIRLMAGLNASNSQTLYLIVLLYNLIISIFIILTKPISGSYGQKKQSADYRLTENQ